MGRNIKYANAEDRLEARRSQTRAHVRAFRERQRRDRACQQRQVHDAALSRYLPPQQAPALNNVRHFFRALLDDFQRITHVGENYLEHLLEEPELSPTSKLIMRSNIANYASVVGIMTGHTGLRNIAIRAYHETIKSMRSLLSADPTMTSAVQLVLMTHDMANYELAEILRVGCNLHHPDLIPNAFEKHTRAGNAMLQQSDPKHFTSRIGAEVLLAHLSDLIMFACGVRKATFVTLSEDWCRVVTHITSRSPVYADTILPLAFQVPAIMEGIDEVLAQPAQASQSRPLVSLLTRIERLQGALGDWLLACEAKVHAPEDGKVTSFVWQLDRVRGRLFPYFDVPEVFAPTVDFATHGIAIATSVYWTWALQLSIMADDICHRFSTLRSFDAANGNFTGMTPQHAGPSSAQIADLICRSFGYWMRSSETINEIQICFSFPHRIAWRWYARQGGEFESDTAACAKRSELLRKSGIHGFILEYITDTYYALPP